jgi:tetratricopeptide (TPR) repeat protein
MAGTKDAFQKAMNQGHSAAWDQDWEQAEKFYNTALELQPDNAQALSSLGLALFELQDFPASLQCYQKAAAQSPEDPIPQEKIARIYERMGRLNDAVSSSQHAAELHLKARSADKAIDNWTRVLSLQPENTTVRTRLAAVYERMGRKDMACNEYIALASLYQRKGDLTRAYKLVEYAHKLMPENQEVRLALSMLRGNQQLPRPSRPAGGTGPVRMAKVREMEQAQGIRTSSIDTGMDPIAEARQRAMVQLAGLLFDQAEENITAAPSRSRGISALTRGLGIGEGSEAGDRTRMILHLSQAIDSQTMDDLNQCVVELEHAIQLGLRHPAGHFDLGLLLKDENSDRALRYLQQAVRSPDYALATHLITGQIYEKAGQWAEAAGAYIQALSLADAQMVEPDQAEELTSAYDAMVDSLGSEPITSLQSTCKAVVNQLLRPDWRSYLMKAREHLPALPDGSAPSPVAEMVLETRSGQVVEAMAQVRKLAAAGQLRSALEEALYALQYAPNYLPLHVLIGEMLLQEGHTGEAVHKFTVIAELYSVRGEVNRAVRLLRRVGQLMPGDLSIRQRIIDILIAQEKIEEALPEYISMAEMYYSLAELDKARQIYLDALKVAQQSKNNRTWGVNMLLKVADIDMQRLNLRQALRVFEQVRAIQPDNSMVRMQIVNLNFRLGQEPVAMKELDGFLSTLESSGRREEAIQFISDLLVDHSGRLDLRRRLADVLIRDGKVGEAAMQLDAAADALLSEGKTYEAINLLETIINITPPNVQAYRQALESLRRDLLRK